MVYLESYHLKELRSYCQHKCQQIILSGKFNDNIEYYRGLWIGYIYCIKVSNNLIIKNTKVKKQTLYLSIKHTQKKHMDKTGFKDAMYDILNFVSNIGIDIVKG